MDVVGFLDVVECGPTPGYVNAPCTAARSAPTVNGFCRKLASPFPLSRPEASAESFDDGWFRTGDMAVVGVPDETWGEAVAAAVVLAEGARLHLPGLRD